MPSFPTFNNGIVSQLPYGEEDDFLNFENYLESGFVTNYSLNPTLPQKVFSVNFPNITTSEVATFEAFYQSVGGQLGTFQFIADDGTTFLKCRFDASKYTVTYVGPNEYSLQCTVRAMVPSSAYVILPGKRITAATLYTLTSHVPNPAGSSVIAESSTLTGAFGYPGVIVTLNGFLDGSAWTLRTDSISVGAVNLPDFTVGFRLQYTGGPGSFPIDQLLVYDCYLNVTHSDGTTATLRPSQWGFFAMLDYWSNSNTAILNGGNAVDGNPATAATIQLSAGAILSPFSSVLQLTNFV